MLLNEGAFARRAKVSCRRRLFHYFLCFRSLVLNVNLAQLCVPCMSLSSSQVRKLQAFVKDQHPTAVCLETVAVSKGIVEQLEAVADEAVAQESWFEVKRGCSNVVGRGLIHLEI